VIDTGGLGNFDDKAVALEAKMEDQAWQAIVESDIIFFMVDGRVGCTPLDEALAKKIRNQNKTVFLLVNKTDGLNPEVAVADFYTLRLGEPIAIAASHGRGVLQLMEKALEDIQENQDTLETQDTECFENTEDAIDTEDTETQLENSKIKGIKVAIIGRPNVGKSTLVNRMLGEERVLVFDEAGTTRDSIYIPFERDGHLYTIIDTAGVRRRARIQEAIEKFSIVKTLQAIENCDVVIAVLDARASITEQDLSLLGFILHSGRSLVIAINKWDGLLASQKEEIKRALKHRLQFVDYAKLHFISAMHGTGVGHLFKSVQEAYHAATKELRTPELTRVLAEAVTEHQPPLVRGRRIKLRYAHAGGHRPPIIVIHGNQTEEVPHSYQRYLMNVFRKAFRLVGTPVRLEFKTSDNPYKGRRNTLTPRQQHKKKRLLKFHKKKGK
jgi:GTP-binding protein